MTSATRWRWSAGLATVVVLMLLGTQALGSTGTERADPVPTGPTAVGIPISIENDTSPVASPDEGGTLPRTGERIAVIGAFGLALVGIGGVLLVASRRRRRGTGSGPPRQPVRPIGGRP